MLWEMCVCECVYADVRLECYLYILKLHILMTIMQYSDVVVCWFFCLLICACAVCTYLEIVCHMFSSDAT